MFNDKKLFIRCSLHPTSLGFNLSLRKIVDYFFPFQISDSNKSIIVNSNGLNLIAGTVGSGKTTLLYQILKELPGFICTLEDPIERMIGHFCQTDVSVIGYDKGLQSLLRQKPSIISIGEIRDKDSAKAAIYSVLTGHSVWTTIHGISIKSIFKRLKDLSDLFHEEIVSNIIFINQTYQMNLMSITNYKDKNVFHNINNQEINSDIIYLLENDI